MKVVFHLASVRSELRRWRWLRCGLAAALIAISSLSARTQELVVPEYKVKAAFLYNFAKLVTWPPAAFASPTAPLVIGVLGTDPFGTLLTEAVKDKTIGGRSLAVRRFATAAEVKDCQVLFISGADDERMAEDLAALAGRSVLTVGETDAFSRAGGMIRLVKENDMIRLRINLKAAHQAHLTISSKLLRLATLVQPPAAEGGK